MIELALEGMGSELESDRNMDEDAPTQGNSTQPENEMASEAGADNVDGTVGGKTAACCFFLAWTGTAALCMVIFMNCDIQHFQGVQVVQLLMRLRKTLNLMK